MSIELRAPSLTEYRALRKAVAWSEISDALAHIALQGSLFSVCITKSSQLIGMGRVVGDGGIYFYVQDVIVMPAYQRQGIGSRIMSEIRAYLDREVPEGSLVCLMSAEGLEEFYRRYGFSSRQQDVPGIFMVQPGFR